MLSFLWIGTTLLFFQPSGYTPSSKKVKNENLWRFRNSFSAKLNHPNWHVVPSMGIFRIKIFWYKVNIFFFSVFTDANRQFVLYSNGGSTLLFLIGVHWEAKCELKSSAFFLKLEIIIPFTFCGWILGIFFFFKNVFGIDQFAFGIVEGLSNFLLNIFVYHTLVSTIIFEHSFDLGVIKFSFSSAGLEEYILVNLNLFPNNEIILGFIQLRYL